MQATLIFAGRDWLLPSLALVGVAVALLVWSYRQPGGTRQIRAICFFLKFMGLAALGACLLEPLWMGPRARPGSNHVVVMADNSQGMQIRDRGTEKTRGEVLRHALTADTSGWQSALEANFQVRRYLFDARLQSTREFSELNFDGNSTALGGALRTIRDRYKGRPVAGVLLLTDGNATDMPGNSLDTAGLPPIYPVVFGRDLPAKDLSIQNVIVTESAFEDAPVSIQADVLPTGYWSERVVAQLLDPAGKKLDEQSQKAPKDGQLFTFRFNFRPEKPGISFYRLRVSAAGEMGQFTDPKSSTEATLANNVRVVVVDRGRGPYRVLYVSGRPNWEFKFLKRATDADDQVQLVALIRIAKREPKFEFKGRGGESSNPLFRGFSNQAKDEIERYDQPVLIRLNTRDELELRGGFPSTPEDLFGFHAVIIGDLESEFFTHDQMSLLQRFVGERGGGLLMLGGMECFQQGHYARTPVGDMLPVYLDRAIQVNPTTPLRFALTREGFLQPWARVRRTEAEEKSRIEAMPEFEVLNQVRETKPGATVIATVSDEARNRYPAVVVQRFGRGRTGAIMLGDLWRWQLPRTDAKSDLEAQWRQIVRWLVSDSPNRVELVAELQRDDPNQPVLLSARVRDEKFQPLDNATVSFQVRRMGDGAALTNVIRLNADPSAKEPGLFQAAYVPRETGGYWVEASVTNNVGALVGRAEAAWATDMAAEEFRSLKPNRPLLEDLARKTGGKVFDAADLAALAQELPNRKAPIMENWSFPVWHQPAVFLFTLVCFLSEWGLRRWKGLP